MRKTIKKCSTPYCNFIYFHVISRCSANLLIYTLKCSAACKLKMSIVSDQQLIYYYLYSWTQFFQLLMWIRNMQCSFIVFLLCCNEYGSIDTLKTRFELKKKESESIQRVLITYMKLDSIELR